jgi:hypothetical protein
MKIKAPFAVEQIKQLGEAQRDGKLPLCLNLTNSYHRDSPWRRTGEYKITSIGLICADCGHIKDEIMIPL